MIIGHKTQISFLENAITNKRVPQTLLFSGSNCLGKKKVALHFLEKLTGGVNLTLVEPQKKVIQIDKIREIKKALVLKSNFKSIIIDDAHLMNKEAQNCFLKTLEEPHRNVFFILVTSFPDMLLKTVVSRCEELKFYLLREKEMIEGFSDKKDHPNFKEIIDLAEGSPGKASLFFEDEKMFKDKEKIKNFLEKDLKDKFAFSKDFFSSENDLGPFLEELLWYFRKEFLKGDYSLKKQIKEIENLKFLSSTFNINQRLGFENLILNL